MHRVRRRSAVAARRLDSAVVEQSHQHRCRDFQRRASLRPNGSWWYRTEFTPSADFAALSNWLALDGINYRANVWLNGVQIASSDKTVGTYASFEWKVALKPGVPNALAIQVTAPDLAKDLGGAAPVVEVTGFNQALQVIGG